MLSQLTVSRLMGFFFTSLWLQMDRFLTDFSNNLPKSSAELQTLRQGRQQICTTCEQRSGCKCTPSNRPSSSRKKSNRPPIILEATQFVPQKSSHQRIVDNIVPSQIIESGNLMSLVFFFLKEKKRFNCVPVSV